MFVYVIRINQTPRSSGRLVYNKVCDHAFSYQSKAIVLSRNFILPTKASKWINIYILLHTLPAYCSLNDF